MSTTPRSVDRSGSTSSSASPRDRHQSQPPSAIWLRLVQAARRLHDAAVLRKNTDTAQQTDHGILQVNFIENGVNCVHDLDAIKVMIDRPQARNDVGSVPVQYHYSCGKSPVESAHNPFTEHEEFIVQGIVSGQGVYQFVSPRTHFRPAESTKKPIIGALREQWQAHQKSGTQFVLGGRFEVVSINPNELPEVLPDGIDPRPDQMHFECELTVIDLQHPDDAIRRIPMTQAGLKFSDKCLASKQIVQAHNILQDHQKRCMPSNALRDAHPQSLPTIASPAGRGRAPTLIVYNEIFERINAGLIIDKASLEATLLDVINDGRKARIASDLHLGRKPDLHGFVHSDNQLRELKIALEEHLQNKIAIDGVRKGVVRGDERLVNHASAAMREHRFSLLQNNGKGDCLFHALEGTERSPSLSQDRVVEIRQEVAAVIAGKKDSDSGKRRNASEINEAKCQEDPSFIPEKFSVTNEEMAVFQAEPERIAGYMELKQWLEIPRNHDKTVVIVDALHGSEMIDVFTPFVNPQTGEINIHHKRTELAPSESRGAMSENEIVSIVDAEICKNASPTQTGTKIIPPSSVVLYRTRGHFARLTGIKTKAEMEADVKTKAAENLRLLQASNDPNLDISKLGWDTH